MPKLAKPLTALEVKRIEKPGLHAVGTVSGLRLFVRQARARRDEGRRAGRDRVELDTKNETMVRVRNRIELVLAWAMQRGYRPDGPNPARWRGNLDAALPKPSKVAKREHFAAVSIDGMHGFMMRLREVEGMGARALEFAILTAAARARCGASGTRSTCRPPSGISRPRS